MDAFEKWFRTFIDEKNPEVIDFIETRGENIHVFDNYDVVEWIVDYLSPADKKSVKDKLVELDFRNGDINHFLEYMGKGFVNNVHQIEGVN